MRYPAKAALVAALLTSFGSVFGATTLTATPGNGHPSLAITVTGAGFGASEAVDVYFDTVDTVLAVTSATGALNVPLTIPASAQPGTHYITAIGRKSGDAVQKTFAVLTAWVEAGFGAGRLGWNPYENTLSTSVVPSLELQWAAPIPVYGAPVIVNGYAFVGAAGGPGGFYGLNATTGAVRWSANLGTPFAVTPAFANNIVYAEDELGNIRAYTAGTGKQQWTKNIGEASAQPLLFAGGVLYAAGFSGIFTFSASGTAGWSYSAAGGVTSVAVGVGLVCFGSSDGIVHALNASTGTQLWSITVANGDVGEPTLANGILYIGDADGNFYAIEARTGGVIWNTTTAASIAASPAVANGVVYVTDTEGDLYAYAATKGTLLWSTTVGSNSGNAGPSIADGVIYTASSGLVTALDARTGQYLTGVATGFVANGAPVVVNGLVYAGDTDINSTGYLYALAPNGAGADAMRRGVSAPAFSSLHPDPSLVPVH